MALFDSLFGKAANQAANKVANQAVNKAAQGITSAVNKAVNTQEKIFVFQSLPMSAAELQALPEGSLQDPLAVAALTVLALAAYPVNKEACFEMMNFLKGPEPLNGFGMQAIRDRYSQNGDYLMRSYFAGATPENNYTPTQPYRIKVIDSVHSRDTINEGFVTMYVACGGADNPRSIVLRTKKSTGQWFVNMFEGLMSGVKTPVEADPWA